MANLELTVWEHLEDFDNAELSYEDWKQQLKEAVADYNTIYGTDHNPAKTVIQYINRQSDSLLSETF